MTIKEQKALLIEQVVLTDEEVKEAIIEAKKRKYFKEKHKDYWNDNNGVKGSKRVD